MEEQIINIPDTMLDSMDTIHNKFTYEYLNMSEPSDMYDFIRVKMLAICNALLVLKNIPLYSPDAKDLNTIKTYGDEEDDEDIIETVNEAEWSLVSDYFSYCHELLSSLQIFGWKLVVSEEKYFQGADALEALSNERLSAYPDFQEFKQEFLKNATVYGSSVEMYVFTHQRLGKYMRYSMEHSVDQRLHAHIQECLSKIVGVLGEDNVTFSNKSDGYEVVYLIISDCSSYPQEHQIAFSMFDLFLPIHAANLEKLLDKAYAMYPIEK